MKSFTDWLKEQKGPRVLVPLLSGYYQQVVTPVIKSADKQKIEPFHEAVLGSVGAALDNAVSDLEELLKDEGGLVLPRYNKELEYGARSLKGKLRELASQPTLAEFFKESAQRTESVGTHRGPKPRGKMVLDAGSAKELDEWLTRPASTESATLWFGLVQIGERTGEKDDTLFLARLSDKPEPKNLYQLPLKAEDSPTAKDRQKSAEQLTGQYRFLKRLWLGKVAKTKNWNGVDPALLERERCWHEAGCFYGFYLVTSATGTVLMVFKAAALNRYANALFGDDVPKQERHTLSAQRATLWARYCQELKELGKAEPDTLTELRQLPCHRFHLGEFGYGTKRVPPEFAAKVVETLKAWDGGRQKK